MKVKSIHMKDEVLAYCEDLAVALDRSTAYIIRELMEYAIEKHKAEEFELK